LDDIRTCLVVEVPGVGDYESEKDSIDGSQRVEKGAGDVVVLAEEMLCTNLRITRNPSVARTIGRRKQIRACSKGEL